MAFPSYNWVTALSVIVAQSVSTAVDTQPCQSLHPYHSVSECVFVCLQNLRQPLYLNWYSYRCIYVGTLREADNRFALHTVVCKHRVHVQFGHQYVTDFNRFCDYQPELLHLEAVDVGDQRRH